MIRTTMIGVMTLAGVAAACLAAPRPAFSQTSAAPTSGARIEVGEDRAVEIGADTFAAVEPYLAADPRDPAHLVAGAFLVAELGDPRRPGFEIDVSCAALTSFDAGRTWTRHDFPGKTCADPWVGMLRDGSAVFVGLDRGTLFAYRSEDGGRTWSDGPVTFGSGYDHPTLAVDTTSGPFGGSVYAASNHRVEREGKRRGAVFVARSADGGVTFGEPAHVIASNLRAWPMNPVVLSDGTLVVPFMNFSRITADGDVDFFGRTPSWVVASHDGGATFSVPRFMTDACRAFSQLAVDAASERYRDRLYWACNDEENEHIYVVHSSDRGETWSEPIAVNRGSGRRAYVLNPAVAVNRDGVVGVSWYDARNDPRGYRGDFRCQEVFFTASLDGGRTWLPEEKVSSDENCPDTPANGEAGRRWSAGGDYHGLAAAADGRFHLLWADSREGIYQLRTATIRVDGAAATARQ